MIGVTHGEVLAEREVGGFALTLTVHPPSFHLPTHGHAHLSAALPLFGGYSEIVGSRRFELEPGSVFWKGPGEEHGNVYSGSTSTRTVLIEAIDRASSDLQCMERALTNERLVDARPYSGFGTEIERELLRREAGWELTLESTVLELLAKTLRLSRTKFGAPSWLNVVREYLHDNFAVSFSISAVAAEVGVHRVHLSRSFKKHYGCSIGQYVRSLRLDAALCMLRDSDRSLSDIALLTGFADQSHLGRSFRSRMGCSPGAYRRALG